MADFSDITNYMVKSYIPQRNNFVNKKLWRIENLISARTILRTDKLREGDLGGRAPRRRRRIDRAGAAADAADASKKLRWDVYRCQKRRRISPDLKGWPGMTMNRWWRSLGGRSPKEKKKALIRCRGAVNRGLAYF